MLNKNYPHTKYHKQHDPNPKNYRNLGLWEYCSTLELDDVDRHILNMLQDDARRSFKDIAKKKDVSEATVFFRVRKLVKNGVIKSFRAIVDPKSV